MNRKAFSLLDLSITLVILSTITGVIIASKFMITESRMQSVFNEYINIRNSIDIFRSSYNCIPGDCGNIKGVRFSYDLHEKLREMCSQNINGTKKIDSASKSICMMFSLHAAGLIRNIDPTRCVERIKRREVNSSGIESEVEEDGVASSCNSIGKVGATMPLSRAKGIAISYGAINQMELSNKVRNLCDPPGSSNCQRTSMLNKYGRTLLLPIEAEVIPKFQGNSMVVFRSSSSVNNMSVSIFKYMVHQGDDIDGNPSARECISWKCRSSHLAAFSPNAARVISRKFDDTDSPFGSLVVAGRDPLQHSLQQPGLLIGGCYSPDIEIEVSMLGTSITPGIVPKYINSNDDTQKMGCIVGFLVKNEH